MRYARCWLLLGLCGAALAGCAVDDPRNAGVVVLDGQALA